ncbi:MAG: capsular biosynthesis protein, partial [Sphingobacteriales bacterium]
MNNPYKDPQVQNFVDESEELFDFKGFFFKVIKDWWVILLSVLICFTVAFIYLRYSTPVYKIHATLMVVDEKKGGGGGTSSSELFGGDISSLLGGKSSVDNEVEILKTRFLIEKVVRGMDLNIAYFKNGRVKLDELYNIPFKVNILTPVDTISATKFNVNAITENQLTLNYIDNLTQKDKTETVFFGKPFKIAGVGLLQINKTPNLPLAHTQYCFIVNAFDATVTGFQGNLLVSVPNKMVTTINLEISYPVPQKGEDILNKIVQEYIQQRINDKNEIADSTIQFIENRLLYVGRELGDVEGNIQSFKQNNKIADIDAQSQLLIANTSTYINKLADIETQISIIDALVDYLKDETKNKRVVPGSILPQDEIFADLVGRYNGLLLETERLLLTSTESNPYIKNLKERVASLRADMLSNLANTRSAFVISKNALNKTNNNVAGLIRNVPAQERTYLDLARQQRIKQELYIFLLQKREETAISKTANISSSRVIDQPKSEAIPFSPKRKFIWAIALIIGLILPLIRIYIA